MGERETRIRVAPARPRILFNVGNGVGLGHQVRCLNLAQELRERSPEATILFISQSNHVTPIADAGFSIVRSPPTPSLVDAATRSAYLELIADVIGTFEPDVYIQDGIFSDEFHGHRALEGPRKVLVTIRYSEPLMQQLLDSRRFACSDLVIVAQSPSDFFDPLYSSALRGRLLGCSKIVFCGPVARQASPEGIRRAQSRYSKEGRWPLVVFVAGGGGQHEHVGSTDADTFFAMAQAASRAVQQARSIIVTGPYGPGLTCEAARIVRYEPDLPALLALASVVVLRPGYNTLHETLLARRPSIIVPTTITGEEQGPVARHLESRAFCRVVELGDSIALINTLRHLVESPDLRARMTAALEREGPRSGTASAVTSILGLAGTAR